MNKPKRLFVMTFFICSTLLVISLNAEASYIVKLKSDIRLFSVTDYIYLEPLMPEMGLYTVDDISELNPDMCEYIEEDAPVELFGTYDFAASVTQNGHDITGIRDVWETGVYGNGVRIGVIDSGCNQHIALQPNLKEGSSFVDGVNDTIDNIGHGTGVCGIAAGSYGFENILGTAHKAEIIPLKFIDISAEGKTIGGTTSRLAKAIISAVDDYDCDVINLSCGTIESATLKNAVDYAVSKGAVLVAAVGNSGNSGYNYPAAYENVIGVGAVDGEKNHASFSNTNDSVYVTAPGQGMRLLKGITETKTDNGTSFSTPYVSGIIADMLEINPDLSTEEIMTVISETAEDLGEVGYDTVYGYGLIRADNIIEYLLRDIPFFTTGISICSTDDNGEVRVRAKDMDVNFQVILASYNDGCLNDISLDMTNIYDKIFMVRISNICSELKYFCWDSLNSMKPLRIYSSKNNY